MKQKDMQRVWDRELLQGWKEDQRMMRVVSRFLFHVKPSLVDDFGAKEGFRDFFVPLGLKRCTDRANSKDQGDYFGGRGPVRGFISSRCERLSNCLWSGKYTNEKLLDNIDNFSWKRTGKALRRKYAEKAKNKLKARGVIRIKARELSKKHDWDTVK